MGSIETMVQHAIDIANDDSHGYSWADRWNVDRDCSSLMYDSADAAGYPVGRGPDKTRYTGTMIPDFTAAGFTCYDYGTVELQRGDILLRNPWSSEEGHTEMYIGDGMNVGAHCSEDGTAYGQPGDQTGYEISITPNYGNWQYVLRPEEDDMSADQVWNHELQGPNAKVPAGQRLVDIQAKFYDKTDYSGRGKESTFIERLCWMAAKQEKQGDLLVAIAVKVGIPEEEAKKILSVEPAEEAKGDE